MELFNSKTSPFKTPLELNIFKIEHLALQLNINQKYLLKTQIERSNLVSNFEIFTGKSGTKKRIIHSPNKQFKITLRKINKFLQNKSKFSIKTCGGLLNRDIFDMVNIHCGNEAVYQVDIKDFFPSISWERIYKTFLTAKCSVKIAELLTDLVTYDRSLPQGFPTSPIIANLVSSKLDWDHDNICNERIYKTRWIDDIVFSGRIKDLEKNINKIITAIKRNGFKLNSDKTKFTRRKDTPMVVGLSVNKHKPYVPKYVVKRLEELLIFASEYGLLNLFEAYEDEFSKLKNKNEQSIKNSLKGKLRYIEQFNHEDYEKLIVIFKNL